MRKFVLACLLLLSGFISTSLMAQTVTVGSDTITTGGQANVDVNFTNNGTVLTVFVEINYNTNALNFVSCSNCTPISPGIIEVTASDPSVPIANGALASLQFQNQPGFTGTTNLTVGTISECLDISGIQVACNFNGGGITVTPPAPIGTINPISLTPTVAPNQIAPVQTITVGNDVTATADLNIANIAISVDTGNGIFSITGGDCGIGTTLAPGDQCTIDVTFQGAPAAPDDTIGVLAVITNDINLRAVDLNGLTRIVNIPPTISPNPVDFNTLQLGTTRTLSATISNPNTFSDLMIFDSSTANPPTITGTGFSIANNNCATVLAGGSCTVDITYTPVSVGTDTGSFSVAYCFLDPNGLCLTAPQPLSTALRGQGFVPTVTITSDDPDAAEAGLDPGSFLLTLDQPTDIPITINYTVAGSAGAGVDYQALPASVTIVANQQQASIAVTPIDDTLVEADETVDVTLQASASYNINAPGTATVIIVSDDVDPVSPTVNITTIQNAEEEGTVSGFFRVSLSEVPPVPLQISYTVAGTATADVDYSALSGQVTVPAGQLSADISVDPVDDEEIESDETVIVTLTSIAPVSAGYVFGVSTRSQLRILDNDSDSTLPQVSINAAGNAAEEGLVNGAFSVTLDTPAPTGGLTISYSVAGSASAGLDYQTLSGTVTIASGQSSASITVTPLSDSEVEGDETVTLTLLNDASYQINPAAGEASIIITDFVETLPQVSINAVNDASETNLVNGAFRVTLNTPAPATGLAVLYNVDGSASPGADYQTLSGTVIFSAGQDTATITVVPLSDSEVEDDETVRLTLLIDADYVINASASQAQILITDLNIPDTPLSDLPGLTPPQKEIAVTVEDVCRNRSASNNFLRDCDALIAAAVNNDPNVTGAIGQITPTDVNTAIDIAETSVQAQLQNIRTRLFTLRRNRTGIDVDDLHLDFDAWVLSGKHLRMLAEQGGAAGDEDSSDARAKREPSRLGIFISGNVSLGDSDASENQDGFEFNTYGVTAGLDYRFTDKLVAGAALTYANNDTDIDNQGGNLGSDGYALTLYGMYYLSEKVYIDGSMSYGRYDYDQERNLSYQINGLNVDQTFDADYDGRQYSVDIGGGYEFVWDQLLFGPTARLNYVESVVKGYSERARNNNPGSAWAVQIEEQKQRSLTVSVGAEATYVIPQSWGSLSPQMDFEWVHELLDDDVVVNGRFVEGDNTPENQFQLPTDEPDSNYFSLGAGLSAQWDVGASAFIQYRTVLGYDRLSEHSVNAGFRWEF